MSCNCPTPDAANNWRELASTCQHNPCAGQCRSTVCGIDCKHCEVTIPYQLREELTMFRYNRANGQYSVLNRIMGMMVVCLLSITSGIYSQERWTELSAGSKAELWGVFFVSNDTGYVVGDSAVALKTIDGGMTWKAMLLPEKINDKKNVGFMDVFFINSKKGFISGHLKWEQGILLRTDDGGNNWEIVFDSIGIVINEIQYQIPHSTRLLLRGKGRKESRTIGGSSEVILISQDSGKTWEQLPQAFDSTVVSSQAHINFYSIVFQSKAAFAPALLNPQGWPGLSRKHRQYSSLINHLAYCRSRHLTNRCKTGSS